MESNGLPGRIHCSQQTADELTKRGKGYWLTPREDKIQAKGKGLLQTYFVDPTSTQSVYSQSAYTTTDEDDDNTNTMMDDVSQRHWSSPAAEPSRMVPETSQKNNPSSTKSIVSETEC